MSRSRGRALPQFEQSMMMETTLQVRDGLGIKQSDRAKDDVHARSVASLLAGALGDAAGYLVEFSSLDSIRREYGSNGLRLCALQSTPLIVSDDTQMTLFTLEGLLAAIASGAACPEEVEGHLREAYLDWYGTQSRTDRAPVGELAKNPLLRQRRAPGRTCMSALQANGNTWAALPDRTLNNSKGCGTVMRTAPIGWFSHWSPEEAFEIGMRASVITHNHPTGFIAGGAMAAMIRLLIGGAGLTEAARLTSKIARNWPGHEETVSTLETAVQLADSPLAPCPDTIAKLGEGWVAEEALAMGLYAAIRGKNMVESLEIAINHSGDSDSTASIAGQLRGAAEGLQGLPFGLVRNLDVYELIREICNRAFQHK